MIQRKIRFVDEPDLLHELRRLEEAKAPHGSDIRPPGSSKDDVAIAVALAAFKLSEFPEEPLPILVDTYEFRVKVPSWDGSYPQYLEAEDIWEEFPGDWLIRR